MPCARPFTIALSKFRFWSGMPEGSKRLAVATCAPSAMRSWQQVHATTIQGCPVFRRYPFEIHCIWRRCFVPLVPSFSYIVVNITKLKTTKTFLIFFFVFNMSPQGCFKDAAKCRFQVAPRGPSPWVPAHRGQAHSDQGPMAQAPRAPRPNGPGA